MKQITNIAASLLLVGVFAAVPVVKAQDEHRDESRKSQAAKRYYDANHKDYHNWDDSENRQWNVYITDNHLKTHDFSGASKREQADYWKWRHEHPDNR